MRFETPWALLILLLIPVLLYLVQRMGGRGSLRFSGVDHPKRLKKSIRQRFAGLPLFLRILLITVLVVALARPQKGNERVQDISKGVAIEMVVDRSGSMGAEMAYEGELVTRLEVVKRVFEEFISGTGRDLSGRPNDIIGMISFARYADTICPLTLAHGALAQFLKNVKLVQRRNEDGTAIGDAIALAAARLKTVEENIARQTKKYEKDFEIKSKIIILLTDGRNNAGSRTPLEAAALAKKWGIKIYAIGIGGEEGIRRQMGLFGNFLVQGGAAVDQQTLKTIAESTGGIFRLASDADSLRAIYQEIDALEKSEIESIRYLDYQELFQPYLFLALILLTTEIVLRCTVFRRIP